MSQLLLQKLEADAGEVEINTVVDCAYIEHIDTMGGVQLIFTVTNREGYFSDEMSVKEGDLLSAIVSDQKDLNIAGTFRVMDIKPLTSAEKQLKGVNVDNNDFVLVNCLEENSFKLRSRIFRLNSSLGTLLIKFE